MLTPQVKDEYDVCFTQQESSTFILMAAAVNRTHSIDRTISSGSGPGRGPVDSEDRFHPYRQQFSDSTVTAAGGLQYCSSPFSCLQEMCNPDSLTHSSSSEMPTSWDQNNGSIQVSRLKYFRLVHQKHQLDIRKEVDYYITDFRLQAGLKIMLKKT